MTLFKTLLLSALIAVSGAVFAAEDEAAGEAAKPADAISKKFTKLDKNGDGFIDSKEARADKKLAKRFKKIAKKGKLDEPGYRKWATAKKRKKVAKTKS